VDDEAEIDRLRRRSLRLGKVAIALGVLVVAVVGVTCYVLLALALGDSHD